MAAVTTAVTIATIIAAVAQVVASAATTVANLTALATRQANGETITQAQLDAARAGNVQTRDEVHAAGQHDHPDVSPAAPSNV